MEEEKKKKSKLKIIIPVVIAIVVIAIVGAIFLTKDKENISGNKVAKKENILENKVTETAESKYIQIDNIYIDNSCTDEQLNLVYLFYTVKANEQNLQVSSKDIELTINDINKYSCTMNIDYNPNYTDYCYSEFLKDVYVGSTFKVCATYQIPKGDLAPNRTITLSSSKFSDISNLKINTNDIKTLENTQEIAKDLDINIYNANYEARQDADAETVNKVQTQINGYEYSFYPTIGTQIYTGKITFSSPNQFEVYNGLLKNSGTYSVKNKYIVLTFSNSGSTNELEYTFNDSGEITFPTLGGTGTFSSYVDYENQQ